MGKASAAVPQIEQASTNFATTFLIRMRRYTPVAYALIIVIILTTFANSLHIFGDGNTLSNLMNLFMGFYFLVYGIPKLFTMQAFVKTIRQYDVLAKYSKLYAYLFPFIEISFGIAYISGVSMHTVAASSVLNGLVIIFTGLSIYGIARALRKNKQLSCGCLGSNFELPLSMFTVWENAFMLIMALCMIVLYKPMVM